MEPIPLEVARKLLGRDFSNLIQRVQGGGKLTRSERNTLQAMATGSAASEITFERALAAMSSCNPCPVITEIISTSRAGFEENARRKVSGFQTDQITGLSDRRSQLAA